MRLQERLEAASFVDLLRRMGIQTLDRDPSHYGLTLCLGGGEVTLLELAAAYATLPRQGIYQPYRLLEGIHRRGPVRVFSADAAYLVLEALSDDEHLRQAGGRSPRPGDPKIGYKTGTSYGFRDAWALAFSSRFVVGVWLGDPRGKSHPNLVGIEGAAPVALAILREIANGSAEWPRPSSLVEMTVCARTGYPLGRFCPARRAAWFSPSSTKLFVCNLHRRVVVDREHSLELCEGCCQGHEAASQVVEEWPSDVALWLKERRNVPSATPTTRRVEERARPSAVPRSSPWTVASIDPFATRRSSRNSTSPPRRLHWFVDGELHATAPSTARVSWSLTPGAHEVRCVDDRGRAASVGIRVYGR